MKAGVITAGDLTGGMEGAKVNKGVDWSSPTVWATVFVVLAFVYLLIG